MVCFTSAATRSSPFHAPLQGCRPKTGLYQGSSAISHWGYGLPTGIRGNQIVIARSQTSNTRQYDFGKSSTFSAMNDMMSCSVTGAIRMIITSRIKRSTWYSLA